MTSTVAFAKLYAEKTSITAADLLNDGVVPFFAEHDIPVSRILTDRGSEYCGAPDRQPTHLVGTNVSSDGLIKPSEEGSQAASHSEFLKDFLCGLSSVLGDTGAAKLLEATVSNKALRDSSSDVVGRAAIEAHSL